MDEIFLSGYHGTSMKAAQIIKDSGMFKISNGDADWLGSGVYFYFNIGDAIEWNEAEAVIHAVIHISEEEYLDLDTKEGQKIFKAMTTLFEKEYAMVLDKNSAQKNQCAITKMIWKFNPEIKVISATFHSTPTRTKTLIDTRDTRKEFCVRDNATIKYIHYIKKERLL